MGSWGKAPSSGLIFPSEGGRGSPRGGAGNPLSGLIVSGRLCGGRAGTSLLAPSSGSSRPRRPHSNPSRCRLPAARCPPWPRPRYRPALPPPPALPSRPARSSSAPGGVRTRVRGVPAPPHLARSGPQPQAPRRGLGLGPAERSASLCARRTPSGSESRGAARPPRPTRPGEYAPRGPGKRCACGRRPPPSPARPPGVQAGTWVQLGLGWVGGRSLGSLPWFSREAVPLALLEGANGTVLLPGKFPALTLRPG